MQKVCPYVPRRSIRWEAHCAVKIVREQVTKTVYLSPWKRVGAVFVDSKMWSHIGQHPLLSTERLMTSFCISSKCTGCCLMLRWTWASLAPTNQEEGEEEEEEEEEEEKEGKGATSQRPTLPNRNRPQRRHELEWEQDQAQARCPGG